MIGGDGQEITTTPRNPEQFRELAEFAMLASQPDPFDPMDRAIRKHGDEALRGTEPLHASWNVVGEYPLAKGLLAISEVWAVQMGLGEGTQLASHPYRGIEGAEITVL